MAAPLVVESWIWYGCVALTIGLRFIARLLLLKDVRKLQIEDWSMLVVFSFFTVLIVFLNICADVNTNLIPPDVDLSTLTPQDIADRVWGSKCVMIVESMMCCVQWGTKACLLILYYRLTENLRQRIVVQIAAGYWLTTFIVMMSLYYGYWCRPFHAFWQTPTPNVQCATQTHHLIVNLTFNLTSDVLIILIPLPMFVKAHLELKKKLLLIFPFSLGFFTIICAILSKNLSFTQPFSAEWVYWYTREASTAIIVSNMPYSWTLIRRIFRVKAFLNRSGSISGNSDMVEGRHASSATIASRTQVSGATKEGFSIKKMFGKEKESSNTIKSTSESTKQLSREHNSFGMVDWKQADTDVQSHAHSSSSSEGSKSVKEVVPQSGVNDVDRLYKLDDDDDWEESMSSPRHHSRAYEPA